VFPLSLDVATIPFRFESPPTAMHKVEVGQVTASNAPAPIIAPPGVGTEGALIWFCGVDHGDGVETLALGLNDPVVDGGEPLASATDANNSPATVVVITTERVRIVKRDRICADLASFVLTRIDIVTP